MSNKKYAEDAADAAANLYVFECVVGLLEAGTIKESLAGKEKSRIIAIAKRTQAKLLKVYDKNIAKLSEE